MIIHGVSAIDLGDESFAPNIVFHVVVLYGAELVKYILRIIVSSKSSRVGAIDSGDNCGFQPQ